MAPQAQKAKFTHEDYLLFPDDGRRHELIDGEHVVTPAPSTRHQRISGRLFLVLAGHVLRTAAGEVFAAPVDVVLSDTDVVQPDIVFVAKDGACRIAERHIAGAPDLVVEIVSESSRKTDATVKRKLYERHGVREYWLVDPELETVEVLRLGEGGFARAAELSREAGHALETPLLPGLRAALADVFG